MVDEKRETASNTRFLAPRRLLVQRYRSQLPAPLVFSPSGLEIRMAMEEHRSIFALYFAILAAAVLLFTWEARARARARARAGVARAVRRLRHRGEKKGESLF